MSTRLLRSNHNLTRTPIETLVLEHNNNNFEATTMVEGDVNFGKNELDESQDGLDAIDKKQVTSGHDLNDRHLFIADKTHTSSLQTSLSPIQKFDGSMDAGLWLTGVLGKFELCQLSPVERNDLIPEILTGDVLLWYLRNGERMPTFTSFMKNFIQNYDNKTKTQESTKSSDPMSAQMKSQGGGNDQETIVESLRNQMLMNNLEKLEKFTGKSEQNVSHWIREIEQAMHKFKMNDDQKLFFISSCLEAEAREWFFDNANVFPTWTDFIEKLIKTFESAGRGDTAFNRLRHYEQGVNQKVRQYYFDIIRLCKEANPRMDEASKLQYLKDGLKPSLRFDVLLKDPKTPEAFLEYAQRIEELKSLDDKQVIRNPVINDEFNSYPMNSQQFPNYDNSDYKHHYSTNNSRQPVDNATSNKNQFNKNKPKSPYRCYRCGSTDHYIQDCQNFQ